MFQAMKRSAQHSPTRATTHAKATQDASTKRAKPDEKQQAKPAFDLADVQRRIAERKAQLLAKQQQHQPPAPSSSSSSSSGMALHPAVIAAQQKKLQQQQRQEPKQEQPPAPATTPAPVPSTPAIDHDDTPTTTTTDNPYLSHLSADFKSTAAARAQARRAKKALNFIAPGHYVAEAQARRVAEQKAALRVRLEQKAKLAGVDADFDRVGQAAVETYQVPQYEWWDLVFLERGSEYPASDGPEEFDRLVDAGALRLDEVTDLVQHPAPVEPPFEDADTAMTAQPLKLTKQETKKLRRLRRLQEQKDKQEKIRLGLLEPDAPKVGISNMVRVYANDATIDPTALEKTIQAQVQARLEKHLQANEERKLTAEDRSEKRARKFSEDVSMASQCAVFCVRGGPVRPLELTKIRLNALENHFAGMALVQEGLVVVIVQGGQKGVRRFKQLMLNRLKWNEPRNDIGSTSTASPSWAPIECDVVWEGNVPKTEFEKFRMITCTTEQEVRDALHAHYHYYETAKHFKRPHV